MFVDAGLLEPVPRQLHSALDWLTSFLDTVDGPDRNSLLIYSRWRITRRLRTTAARQGDITESSAEHLQTHLRAIDRFLSWLAERDTRLGDATQADIDTYLSDTTGAERHLPQFLTWASSTGHCKTLTAPTYSPAPPSPISADEAHWAIVERLLTDDTLRDDTRIGALFLLLYGQPLSTICRLTRDQLTIDDDHVTIRFAADPIVLPSGLDDIVRRHVEALERRSAPHQNRWLFPGRLPTQPIVEGGLGIRLKQIGVTPRTARTTALTELATHLPAAVLAGFVGITPDTAAMWNRVSGREWSDYPQLRRNSFS